MSTAGPSLSIERDYNSLTRDPTGAFGAGWSSILDAQVTRASTTRPGPPQSMVVTYPDGSQVGFGKNGDGYLHRRRRAGSRPSRPSPAATR